MFQVEQQNFFFFSKKNLRNILANSLVDLWNRKQQEKRAPEFDGRAECPPPRIIPLYANVTNKPLPNTSGGNPSTAIPNVIEKN